jgi:hypothetical protein
MKKFFKWAVIAILGCVNAIILLVVFLLGLDFFGFMPGGHNPCIRPITCGANCTPETPCIGVAE